MGLPVIAYDIPAVQPLIQDTQEGLLAQSFDVASFADKMLAFAQSTPEERRKMAQSAIRKAEELSVEKIVKQWESFI
jgi:glycosyltransferase involved in cell wall biosynthesis